MKVQIETHALERAFERGTNENEIIDTIKLGIQLPAKNNRFFNEKIFNFKNQWNGKYFEEKKVKVVYVIEVETIIVITVIVNYGIFSAIS